MYEPLIKATPIDLTIFLMGCSTVWFLCSRQRGQEPSWTAASLFTMICGVSFGLAYMFDAGNDLFGYLSVLAGISLFSYTVAVMRKTRWIDLAALFRCTLGVCLATCFCGIGCTMLSQYAGYGVAMWSWASDLNRRHFVAFLLTALVLLVGRFGWAIIKKDYGYIGRTIDKLLSSAPAKNADSADSAESNG